MYIGKKKLLMILSIINMYLKDHIRTAFWENLDKLRDEIIERLV